MVVKKMGTRSVTKFCQIWYDLNEEDDDKKQLIGAIYRQFDGYLDGHGKDLKDLLAGKKIINGFSGQTTETSFNGMGCLGAWVIGKLKGDDIGGIYLTHKDDEQEYNYEIWNSEPGDIMIKVIRCQKIIYEGNIEDMPDKEE